MAAIRLQETIETGVFLRRLNRFMVEAEIHGEKVLAHLPNSGRLLTVLVPWSKAFLIKRHHPRRESSYNLFAVEHFGVPIIVDTRFSTVATKASIQKGLFKPLTGCQFIKENVKVDNCLLDLLLKRGKRSFFLEIKCVTHVANDVAMFPDAPTTRGRKHLNILINLVEKGFDAGILFSVQRPDANAITPNWKIDHAFSELLHKAVEKGVKVFTQKLIFQPPDAVELRPNVPVFQLWKAASKGRLVKNVAKMFG